MNKKFRKHLVLQTAMLVFFMLAVLVALNYISATALVWSMGASALASSCYGVFSRPSSITSIPHRIVGGYLIGLASGELTRYLLELGCLHSSVCHPGAPLFVLEIAAAASVGLAFVFMVLTGWEHPPAAGLAIILMLELHAWTPVLVILIAAFLLAFLRWVLGKKLIDLVR